MSGICGFIHFDGRPVEPGLITRMAEALAKRGPDGLGTWFEGPVALGLARLCIPGEAEPPAGPITLDGQSRIVADARLDGRADLVGALLRSGSTASLDCTDTELILKAYRVFGTSCVDHLLGDYSFGIWDADRRRLFGARDPLGLRPFFFHHSRTAFAFSNRLEALLAIPDIEFDLDPAAVGDFLMFGDFLTLDLTIYRALRRLPPAHALTADDDGLKVYRHWVWPKAVDIRYSSESDYIEHFRSVFDLAVKDRAKGPSVALELSGGMDSSAIAACLPHPGTALALTTSCRKILPADEEEPLARRIAAGLGIPHWVQDNGDYQLFERLTDPALLTAEPLSYALASARWDCYRKMAEAGSRVLLTGQAGDACFNPSASYPKRLLSTGKLSMLIQDAVQHVRSTGTLAGMGLRTALAGTRKTRVWRPEFPAWIDPEFRRSAQLDARWDAWWSAIHRTRGLEPQVQAPWFTGLIEGYETMDLPIVTRHPFLDLRVINLLRGLPTTVKCEKRLLREAMRTRLPDEILARPKTCLPGDHIRAMFERGLVAVRPEDQVLDLPEGLILPGSYRKSLFAYLSDPPAASTWAGCFMTYPVLLSFWMRARGIVRG